MRIINLNYDEFMSNSYLVLINDKAYLIDPSINLKQLRKYTDHLDGILITHGHIDHIAYLKEIYNRFNTKVYCHKNAILKIQDNEKNCGFLFGLNKNLDINNYNIIYESSLIDDIFTVMETPGHTDCSVIYLIKDLNKIQGDNTVYYEGAVFKNFDNIMFSGDTLFKDSIGRTDLFSGSMGEMNKTLKRIKSINDDYLIFPGHNDVTLLSIEKMNNVYMKKL